MSTSLLLHFDGANNSTTFIDETGKTVTPSGDAKISTAQSKFGGSSGYFDGSGDYLEVPYSSEFAFTTEDFTIESWCYLTVGGTRFIASVDDIGGTRGWRLTVDTDHLVFAFDSGGIKYTVYDPEPFALNTWIHVAVVRVGDTLRLFKNGIQVASTAVTGLTFNNSLTNLLIGTSRASGTPDTVNNLWVGYLDELKITKNIANYSVNFITPTIPFYIDPQYDNVSLLLPFYGTNNSTTFIDNSPTPKTVTRYGNAKISTAQSKFGGSSGYFDGSSNLEVSPSGIALCSAEDTSSVGTVDFTVEAWVYCSGTNDFILYALGRPGSGTGSVPANMGGLMIEAVSGSVIRIRAGNLYTDSWEGFLNIISTDNIPSSGWCHIAVTSVNNIPHVFINGVESVLVFGHVSTTLTSFQNTKMYCPRVINIMSCGKINGVTDTTVSSTSVFATGYIDDLRITKGLARYTTNFTPPNQAFYYQSDVLPSSISTTVYKEKLIYKDLEDGGDIDVTGKITIDSVPTKRKIRLCCLNNGRVIRETWSDATTGNYIFKYVKNQEYYIWSEDYQRIFDPVSHLIQPQ